MLFEMLQMQSDRKKSIIPHIVLKIHTWHVSLHRQIFFKVEIFWLPYQQRKYSDTQLSLTGSQFLYIALKATNRKLHNPAMQLHVLRWQVADHYVGNIVSFYAGMLIMQGCSGMNVSRCQMSNLLKLLRSNQVKEREEFIEWNGKAEEPKFLKGSPKAAAKMGTIVEFIILDKQHLRIIKDIRFLYLNWTFGVVVQLAGSKINL